MTDLTNVVNLLKQFRRHNISEFYTTKAVPELGATQAETFGLLLDAVREGHLILRWELQCSNPICYHTVTTLDQLPEEQSHIHCPRCGTKNQVIRDVLYPLFVIPAIDNPSNIERSGGSDRPHNL